MSSWWKDPSVILASEVNDLIGILQGATKWADVPAEYRTLAETITGSPVGTRMYDATVSRALIDSITSLMDRLQGTKEGAATATTNLTEFVTVSEMIDMFVAEFGPSEQLEALRQIANNTEDGGGEAGSSEWLNGLIDKLGLSDPLGSILGPIGDTLLSYVTDPIVGALEKHFGPTGTRIEKLADVALRVLDVPLGMLNMALEGILGILGANYTSGRLTTAGAYQFAAAPAGGGSLSISSPIHTGDINIHGVHDGEDAAYRVTHRMAEIQTISSRQQARSLKRGMIKREAQER